VSMDEYWAEDGEPPTWRRKMKIGNNVLLLRQIDIMSVSTVRQSPLRRSLYQSDIPNST
jgi:hypothetical protein